MTDTEFQTRDWAPRALMFLGSRRVAEWTSRAADWARPLAVMLCWPLALIAKRSDGVRFGEQPLGIVRRSRPRQSLLGNGPDGSAARRGRQDPALRFRHRALPPRCGSPTFDVSVFPLVGALGVSALMAK